MAALLAARGARAGRHLHGVGHVRAVGALQQQRRADGRLQRHGCRLVARNTFGGFTSPQGTAGGWRMTAPRGRDDQQLLARWRASRAPAAGTPRCSTTAGSHTRSARAGRTAGTPPRPCSTTTPVSAPGTTQVITRVRCYASSCTNTGDSAESPERGRLFIHNSSMTISDSSPPAVRIAGGSAASRWLEARHADPDRRRGRQRRHPPLRGLRRRPPGRRRRRAATAATSAVSCRARTGRAPSRSSSPGSPTACTRWPGRRSTRRATPRPPASGSRSTTRRRLRRELRVSSGGAGLADERTASPCAGRTRASASRRSRGPSTSSAPPAPTAATRAWRREPASAASRDRAAAAGVTTISNLAVPGEGMWMLRRLWLQDAAGNQNPAAAVKVNGLGFDATPPTGVAFADEHPDDPARLRVRAADDCVRDHRRRDRGAPRRRAGVAAAEHPGHAPPG